MSNNLEAKICVLGAQGRLRSSSLSASTDFISGVGKTSLVHRYVKGDFSPASITSTIGASFLTKRILDIDSGATVRLQIWDTAGQERFRSISKLYYRGAAAVILVYSILDEQSFEEMGRWLMELKENLRDDIIVHVVGTKIDAVAQDPSLRRVPFERCLAYVAEHLHPVQLLNAPHLTAGGSSYVHTIDSKRSSGFWGQDMVWDCCHEISAKDGEGIEEVFRVITRKLVEQKHKRTEQELALESSATPGIERGQESYFDGHVSDGRASFRLGLGDKRMSWLGFPTPNTGMGEERINGFDVSTKGHQGRHGRCC